jgi:hypothetical protein
MGTRADTNDKERILTTLATTDKPAAEYAPAILAQLRSAFGIPDVSDYDIAQIPEEGLMEIMADVEAHKERAIAMFAVLTAEVKAWLSQATAKVEAVIPAGATSYPHPNPDVIVTVTQKMDRERRFDVLQRLEGKVNAEELGRAIYYGSVNVKAVDPKMVDAILAAGGTGDLECNLVKLDALAKKYQGDIAAIITEATPRTATGPRSVKIEKRKAPLMKQVGT